MDFHHLAKYFPILEGEEFDLLVEDIRKNGQLEPIVVYDGKILDGVNRYRACEKLGIQPKMEPFTGDNPLDYVVSINVRRRHMDTSQRAMLATEMLPEFEAEARKRKSESAKLQHKGDVRFSSKDEDRKTLDQYREDSSSVQAAKVFGVSGPTIQRAKRIQQEAPERVKDIISGKATVTSVDEELRRAKSAERVQIREEKENKKLPTEHPKAVKDYLSACAVYRDALELAIRCAKQSMFAPEAIGIIKTKHDAIRALMDEVEEQV